MADEPTDIDWRDIFVRYANQVDESESFMFLDKRNWHPDEWPHILDALDREPDETRF